MNLHEIWTQPDLPDEDAAAVVSPDPRSVLLDPKLTRRQKIDELRRLSYDARELEVADEEGMGGPSQPSNLDAIQAALRELGARDVPTSHKQ